MKVVRKKAGLDFRQIFVTTKAHISPLSKLDCRTLMAALKTHLKAFYDTVYFNTIGLKMAEMYKGLDCTKRPRSSLVEGDEGFNQLNWLAVMFIKFQIDTARGRMTKFV